ncbi:MAG: phosphatidylserine decarboxylase family protein [Acidobacteria bacterium]|nr:phosphatidylserine decarboxylase family protein [Acidobacteriota bacterium]
MRKEGFTFSAGPLLAGAIAIFLNWIWVGVLFLVLGAFVLYFFRDPERKASDDPSALVSPADGHVVEIVEEALDGVPGRRLSIFLSVFDVHVNRSPLAGRVTRIEYRPGKFYAALRTRASEENEQNIIRIVTPQGKTIQVKQIAGWIARRILCWKREGDQVAMGERVGMIRFGSRTDLWMPMDTEIVVRRGQKVAGCSTILARWKSQ